MEELIESVPEKDIANYLREAMTCYGGGAYRGCIVLTHIALFEGIRLKLLALAPVNSVAKSVSQAIEPLASQQKVFELTMVQQMKSAALITQLESDILEQLNKQRNKAAHPSGHHVTAEEARFVFSEAIQKFLSQPIRQTSVLVDEVLNRLSGPNFFPSAVVTDMYSVVEEETKNLDPLGVPQLISNLVNAIEGNDPTLAKNAKWFLISLARKQEELIRKYIIKNYIKPKSSKKDNATFTSELISSDPKILLNIDATTQMRVNALLLHNANDVGPNVPFNWLQNPAHVLRSCIETLGEDTMIKNHKGFIDWVLSNAPYAPGFIRIMKQAPILRGQLLEKFFSEASHSQWDKSNSFAAALPPMDEPLAEIINNEEAFRMVVAIAKGAEWNGFGPLEIINGKFGSIPKIKAMAESFASANKSSATAIINEFSLNSNLTDFVTEYF